jgi:hypothetical protein
MRCARQVIAVVGACALSSFDPKTCLTRELAKIDRRCASYGHARNPCLTRSPLQDIISRVAAHCEMKLMRRHGESAELIALIVVFDEAMTQKNLATKNLFVVACRLSGIKQRARRLCAL